MASSRDILFDVASEFKQVDIAKVDRMLGYAVIVLGSKAPQIFGAKFGLAVAYLAAHYLAMDDRGKRKLLGSGRVTSQTVSPTGQQTVGFAPQLLNKLDSDESYRITPYGNQFLAIRDSIAEGLPLVITSSSG